MNIESFIVGGLILRGVLWVYENGIAPFNMDQPSALYSPLRYPEAFDEVIKVLRLFYHERGRWSITYSDAEDGRIQARMSFREEYGPPIDKAVERQIVLDVFLDPTDDLGTEISLSYNVNSDYDRSTCNQLIEITTRLIDEAAGELDN
jgi:hypothetical protein